MTEIERGPGWWQATDGQWYPPRWEYRWVKGWLNPKRGHEPIEDAVNELGLQGWEAITYSGAADGALTGASHVLVLMKRPMLS